MRRRDFITLIGSAVATWPLGVRAQQEAMPVIGFLSSLSSSYIPSRLPPFRQGLNESGYVEGQNVAIEFRLAEGSCEPQPPWRQCHGCQLARLGVGGQTSGASQRDCCEDGVDWHAGEPEVSGC